MQLFQDLNILVKMINKKYSVSRGPKKYFLKLLYMSML